MTTATDTIAAIATPPGRGGVGIVRCSGTATAVIATRLLGSLPPPRHAQLARFVGAAGETIDTGLALYFPAPHSYTGEDVLELQGHGGPVVLQALLQRALELGARRAEPGEFTQRAYLNDKLDLAQAEAVADLIDAGSIEAARAAMRSLDGEFSALVHALVESLTLLRVHIEAAIDFPEEEVDFLGDAALHARLAEVRAQFDSLLLRAGQGRLLTEGMSVVIAGAPNAGKSTLLNRLAGFDAAIVTDIPGTTRDVLRERIHIDGLPLHVIDTAGLRDTQDVIEAEGVRRAEAEMARADRVLFIIDAVTDPKAESWSPAALRLPATVPVTMVYNKIDALPEDAATPVLPAEVRERAAAWLAISARTGQGLPELREHLKHCVGYTSADAGLLSARARHIAALTRAREQAEAAATQLLQRRAGELVAEELKAAQYTLGEITGEFGSEELLGRIFSSFCIGK